MNWLDIILLILVLGSVAFSFSKGFSREIVGLIAAVAAFFCGIWLYGAAGSFLLPYVSSRNLANFCGFVIVVVGVLVFGALVGHLLSRTLKRVGLSWVDRMLGAGFGLVRGVLLSVALIMAILAFSPGIGANAPPRAVVESRNWS